MAGSRFELHRDHDPTGVSGEGVIAEGVAWPDGVAVVRWLTEWPTSVVFHDRGVESVEHVHGHGGSTRLVWLDGAAALPAMPTAQEHDYTSTACQHRLHDRCRQACKFCGAACGCGCHEE